MVRIRAGQRGGSFPGPAGTQRQRICKSSRCSLVQSGRMGRVASVRVERLACGRAMLVQPSLQPLLHRIEAVQQHMVLRPDGRQMQTKQRNCIQVHQI